MHELWTGIQNSGRGNGKSVFECRYKQKDNLKACNINEYAELLLDGMKGLSMSATQE